MRLSPRFPRPLFATGLALAAGCHTPDAYGPADVSAKLEAREGLNVGPDRPADQPASPPGFDPNRALTEDEAALLALWNNPAFRDILAELGLTRGDLIQAGLLPNPEFIYFFPGTDKPFKYLFDFPLSALVVRPVLIRTAAEENRRACDRVTQAALDLVRDARLAHADVLFAKERVRVAGLAVRLRGRIAELAEARLHAGDATPQEVATARIDALQAKLDVTRIGYEVTLAEARLRNVTGLAGALGMTADAPTLFEYPETDAEALAAEAGTSRPDVAAAEHAARASAERLRFAKVGWVRVLGVLDATSGRNGHEFSPAIRVTLPIFNQNQGLIARGEAELEQLTRRRVAVQNQAILDVRLADARYKQARAELDQLKKTVRPEAEAAVRRAELAYKEGATGYLIALEATRQVVDTFAREAQLNADMRRAYAELERSVGRRLAPGTPQAPPAASLPKDAPQ